MSDSSPTPLDPKAFLALARKLGYLSEPALREVAAAFAKDPKRPIDELCREHAFLSPDQLVELDVRLGRPARVGPYELLGVQGRGAMGIVYRARHAQNGTVVALKLPKAGALDSREAMQRHQEEIYLLDQVAHENIVRLVEAGEEADGHYIALEFAEGPTLAEEIQRHGKIEERRAIELVRQVASAMVHYHSRGFVHRDLKPANMIISAGDRVRILDLGVARQAYLHDSGSERTGSPYYMSPQQIRREGEGDTSDTHIQADLYSVGATLFQMLTGSPPYTGKTVNEILDGHLRSPIPNGRQRCPGTSPYTWEIVEHLLAKDLLDRYQQPFELLQDCESWLEGQPPQHARGRTKQVRAEFRRRTGVPKKAIAIASVAIIALIAVLAFGPKDDARDLGGDDSGSTSVAGIDPATDPGDVESGAERASEGSPESGSDTPPGDPQPSPQDGSDGRDGRDETPADPPKTTEPSPSAPKPAVTRVERPRRARPTELDTSAADARTIESAERSVVRSILTAAFENLEGAPTAEALAELDPALRADLELASEFVGRLRERLGAIDPPPVISWGGEHVELVAFDDQGQVELRRGGRSWFVPVSSIGWSRLVEIGGMRPEALRGDDLEGLLSLYLVQGEVERAVPLLDRSDRKALARRRTLRSAVELEAREQLAHVQLAEFERVVTEAEAAAAADAGSSRFDRRRVIEVLSLLLGELGTTESVAAQRESIVSRAATILQASPERLAKVLRGAVTDGPDGRTTLTYDFVPTELADWDLNGVWHVVREGWRARERPRADQPLETRARFLPGDWKVELQTRDGAAGPSRLTIEADQVRLEFDAPHQQASLSMRRQDDPTAFSAFEAKDVTLPLADHPVRRLSIERVGRNVRVLVQGGEGSPEVLFDREQDEHGTPWRLAILADDASTLLEQVSITARVEAESVETMAAQSEWSTRRVAAVRAGERIRALFPGAKEVKGDRRDPLKFQVTYGFDSPVELLDWTTQPDPQWFGEPRQREWAWVQAGGQIELTHLLADGEPSSPRDFIFPVIGLEADLAELDRFEYEVEVPEGRPSAVAHFVRARSLGAWDAGTFTWLSRQYPGLDSQVARGPGRPLHSKGGDFVLPESPAALEVEHREKLEDGAATIKTSVGGKPVFVATDAVGMDSGPWLGFAAVNARVQVDAVEIAGRLDPEWVPAAWERALRQMVETGCLGGQPFELLIRDDLSQWQQVGGRWKLAERRLEVDCESWSAKDGRGAVEVLTYAPWPRVLDHWGAAWFEVTISHGSGPHGCALVLGYTSRLDPYLWIRVDEEDGQLVASVAQGTDAQPTILEEVAAVDAPSGAKRNKARWRVEFEGNHCRVLVQDKLAIEFDVPASTPVTGTQIGVLNLADCADVEVDDLRVGPLR